MKKKAFIVRFKGAIICAVQTTAVDISHKMLKSGYSVEEAEIEPIPTTEIAVNHGHGWKPAKRYAMHNGEKIEFRYRFFGF